MDTIEAKQMLSLLVMDLGYESAPVHGHHPIRHQLAWEMAIRPLGDVKGLVLDMREQAEFEEKAIKKTGG